MTLIDPFTMMEIKQFSGLVDYVLKDYYSALFFCISPTHRLLSAISLTSDWVVYFGFMYAYFSLVTLIS